MADNTKPIIALVVATLVLLAISYGLVQAGVSGVQAVSSQVAIAIVAIGFVLSGVWVYRENVKAS